MVNIGTLLAFVIVCIAVMVLRHTNPPSRGHSYTLVPLVPVLGIISNGYMMYKLGWVKLGAIGYLVSDWPGRVLHL